MNYRFVGEEIEYIINHSEAKFFFFGAEQSETIAGIHKKLKPVVKFIGVDTERFEFAYNYEEFLSSGKPDEPQEEINENDPCQIMYTSGTTGKPKGAVITHGNLFWNLINTILGRDHRTGEISVIISPLYHTAALNNHFTVQVALGGTSILVKRFEPDLVLRLIEKERANVISGSPTMFDRLLQHPRFDALDTRSITKCTTGASALPDSTKERLIEAFPNSHGVYDLYGCTEASPTITTLKARDSLRKHGSVGLPVPFLQAEVVDEEGGSLTPNEIGELVCRGPNVMQAYFKDLDATKETIKDGWLFTGDLASMDEEGYFYIVDRKKDVIVSGGENIYPKEIEEVLLRHPAIADVAVVGVPHATWGETAKAFVVLKDGKALGEQELIEFCKTYLASYKKPTAVEILSDIPRNPSGKTLKRLLRKKDESNFHG